MAKCAKCRKRKGKRYCAALGDYLCSLCCGLFREKEIPCPAGCSFLSRHKPYQEGRAEEKSRALLRRTHPLDEDVLQDERMAWLAFHIEAPLKVFGERKKSFTDKEALNALEYAKAKIEKDKSLVYMPHRQSLPRNEAGEAVYQSIEKCRFEKTLILPGEMTGYKKEEKMKVLERVMLSVNLASRQNLEGRAYIEQVIQRFSRLKDVSQQNKIVSF